MRRAGVLALAAALLLPAAPRAEDAQQAPADARYQALIEELRCLVCQNQSIAESNAPLAADLREQVRVQIEAGRSDAEIIEFLTARYGDFVLYRPPFKLRTWLLWLGPFALLGVAALVAATFVRRSRGATTAPAAADPEALKRVLGEGRDPKDPGGAP